MLYIYDLENDKVIKEMELPDNADLELIEKIINFSYVEGDTKHLTMADSYDIAKEPEMLTGKKVYFIIKDKNKVQFIQNGYLVILGWCKVRKTFDGEIIDESLPENTAEENFYDEPDKQVIKWIGDTGKETRTIEELELYIKPEINFIPEHVKTKLLELKNRT